MDLPHSDRCECDGCMEILYLTRGDHWEGCGCQWCEEELAEALNRSPAAIVYTDKELLKRWNNGLGIKPAFMGGQQIVGNDKLRLWGDIRIAVVDGEIEVTK